jgi:hydrogenase maturation protease
MNTVVVGLGNLVHSDDGSGYRRSSSFSGTPVCLLEPRCLMGGTHGLALLPHISGFARVLVIDVVDAGEPPGTVVRSEGSALNGLPGKASVHQLGFADMMIAFKLLGESTPELVVLGVRPLSTEWSVELTRPVAAALPALIEEVLRHCGCGSGVILQGGSKRLWSSL